MKYLKLFKNLCENEDYKNFEADQSLIQQYEMNVVNGANVHEAAALAQQYKTTSERTDDKEFIEFAMKLEQIMRACLAYWKINKKAPTKEWILAKSKEILRK